MNDRPIILVEDDPDDREVLAIVIKELELRSKILFFQNGKEAFDFIKQALTPPMLIVSDINMPVMDGFELKKQINKDTILDELKIPFVFLSTSSMNPVVKKAYDLNVQGFFQKGNNFEEVKSRLWRIIDYWHDSHLPH